MTPNINVKFIYIYIYMDKYFLAKGSIPPQPISRTFDMCTRERKRDREREREREREGGAHG